MKTCKKCSASFEVAESDLKFYDKISPILSGKKFQIPPPTLCPDCRQQRRMSWRGKDYFFRKCDVTGKKHLSIYPPEAKMVTYSSEAFHSDDWNGLEYGRDFNFTRPFFDQFFELWQETPKHIANTTMTENSEYIINAHKCKNCYMADEMDYCRDCYYGYNIQHCEDMVNCFYVRKSKACFELSQGQNCHEIFFSHNVYNSSHSAFLKNCRKCTNCLFCVNLRNANYHIFNRPVSKAEFEGAWKSIFCGSQKDLSIARKQFSDFLNTQPITAVIQNNTEDCTGDQLSNCKNCFDCFNIDNCRDCRYCTDIHYSKDCYDVHIYEGDLLYECLHAGPKGYNQLFTHLSWFSRNTLYGSEFRNTENVFGCSGMKRQKYCILNKQYTKKEYEILAGKIIEHMQHTGEWGEFFPAHYSPFGYSQTMAAYYYPLEKSEARLQDFHWMDDQEDSTGGVEQHMPENLSETSDQSSQQVFSSILSGKKYKITPHEISFHRMHNIPLPNITPSERIELFIQQNPRKLYKRTCGKCTKAIQTTYSPDAPQQVYCEECYLAEVY